MLEHLLNTLGPRFVLPAVFLLVGVWAFHSLLGLHNSRRRNRMDFLDVWQDIENMDDLRLEVAIRHLVGSYFPASIIRTINRMPFPSQTLLDLSEVWSLVRFDPRAQALRWKKSAYGNVGRRRWLKAGAMIGYFGCALIAIALLNLIVGTDPTTATAWIAGSYFLILLILALWCMTRFDALVEIGRQGESLIQRINDSLLNSQIDAEADT